MPRSKLPISSRRKKSWGEVNKDDQNITQWARLVDAITRGERPKQPLVRVGPTPKLLQALGLEPSDIMMATGKVALCRREHPEVSRTLWHSLPRLLDKPLAVVPSARRDGSLVVVLLMTDINGDPVLVPIAPGKNGSPNILLSVYGKEDGTAWIHQQIKYAAAESLQHYVGKGFAAALPQPGSANAIPSSPGLIPADGTTKPARNLLRLPQIVKPKS
jgi:Phage MuF-C-terminal domain